MSDFVGNKTARAWLFKMAIYLEEESKILGNYIKLGQPSCYVEHCMLCRARYAISDCHVINVHVGLYNRSNLITQTSVGYHINKHALPNLAKHIIYRMISLVAQETCECICYLTSACSTILFCTYKPHVLRHN